MYRTCMLGIIEGVNRLLHAVKIAAWRKMETKEAGNSLIGGILRDAHEQPCMYDNAPCFTAIRFETHSFFRDEPR